MKQYGRKSLKSQQFDITMFSPTIVSTLESMHIYDLKRIFLKHVTKHTF